MKNQQIQNAAGQLEIPRESNNTTRNLEKKKFTVTPQWTQQQTKAVRSNSTHMNNLRLGSSHDDRSTGKECRKAIMRDKVNQ